MNIKYLRKPPPPIPQTIEEITSQYCKFSAYKCVKCEVPMVFGVSRICKGKVKELPPAEKEIIITDEETGVTGRCVITQPRVFVDSASGLMVSRMSAHLGAVED